MGVTTCLAAIRAERKLTQADVAAMAKVSRQTINSIETGRFEPSLSLALTLARLFARPVEDIFTLPDTDPGWAAASAARQALRVATAS